MVTVINIGFFYRGLTVYRSRYGASAYRRGSFVMASNKQSMASIKRDIDAYFGCAQW